jgi:hypothetical protein
MVDVLVLDLHGMFVDMRGVGCGRGLHKYEDGFYKMRLDRNGILRRNFIYPLDIEMER